MHSVQWALSVLPAWADQPTQGLESLPAGADQSGANNPSATGSFPPRHSGEVMWPTCGQAHAPSLVQVCEQQP